ncbi:MAG: RNA polymerase factor sigma-54 [Bacteroidales bacterium]
MLKQRLQQKLLQKLSPQQIQMIKLLEIPTIQLEQRIKKELEENPVLEEGDTQEDSLREAEDEGEERKDPEQDEFTFEDYLNDEEIPSYKLQTKNYSPDDKRDDIPFSTGTTFHEYLEDQLGLRVLTERQQQLSRFILGNIDDDGYLRRNLESIANDLAFTYNIQTSEEELLEILRIIQDFDPVGVGARDLQECLILQIDKKDQTIPRIELARKILKHHFEEFTRKHYDKIISRLNITEEELGDAIHEILKLNPKPGGGYSDPYNKSSSAIIPDFILEYKDGELQLSLNAKNVPELRLSKTYSDMIQTYGKKSENPSKNRKEVVSFVKQKLESAKWFIDAIKQRQNTLMVTMQAIIDYQKEYFMEGDETKLRPMILKDIADRTGLDISTISRVANSKYIQTHFGIYSLKYFFSEGLQTESGEEVSTREIKKILGECIANEDKKKPLTDEKLASILQEKGYYIARRTVAKYREQLNIPVARLRKELN